VRLIVIDDLKRFNNYSSEGEWKNFYLIKGLKDLAREINVPIVVMTGMKSGSELKSVDRTLSLSDIYDDEDGTHGLETKPHTTLLYGLHDNDSIFKMSKYILENAKYDDCEIKTPSLFENEKYDVLKFDVDGSFLYKINKELSKLPHTTDYPDYHPHLTIGYLKPGCGKKYVKIIKEKYKDEIILTPKHAVYSYPDRKIVKIEIN
jgi:hypothetical protein